MKNRFKPHIQKLERYKTSIGRDLEAGLRLDRNERVADFAPEVLFRVFAGFRPCSISASPDAASLYGKISSDTGAPVENIYITNGITEGIRILYETITNPGDNVVVLDPTYPMYSIYAKIHRVEYRRFRFKRDLSPDMQSLYNGMDPRTAMVMIPNPNLPVESVFGLDDVRAIAELCKLNNTVLVIDEAYYHFGAPTVLELLDEYANFVVMRTFSKSWGLAGLRIGYMVSSAENIHYLMKTVSLAESNALSMGVAEYMLDHPELRDEHVKEVREGAKYIQRELTGVGLRWHGGNVTNGIMIFLETSGESRELVDFLKERKVYIRGGFLPPYDNCVRVSIGPRRIMEDFMGSLNDWLKHRDGVKVDSAAAVLR